MHAPRYAIEQTLAKILESALGHQVSQGDIDSEVVDI